MTESKMHIDDAIDSLNHPINELIRWIDYKERQAMKVRDVELYSKKIADPEIVKQLEQLNTEK